ncbi:MAG: hypothetical protein U5K72_05550 [Balneolaceae bacterium]|nr:hypothetical protein [Balneolaceae bacterium]
MNEALNFTLPFSNPVMIFALVMLIILLAPILFFNQTAVNAVVILILITCLVGPWLVEKYGQDVAVQEESKPYEPSEAPQRILVPLANPETSDTLMDIACMIRKKNLINLFFRLL